MKKKRDEIKELERKHDAFNMLWKIKELVKLFTRFISSDRYQKKKTKKKKKLNRLEVFEMGIYRKMLGVLGLLEKQMKRYQNGLI